MSSRLKITYSIYFASVALYMASLATGIAAIVYVYKRFVLKLNSVAIKNALVLCSSLAIATFIFSIAGMVYTNFLINQTRKRHNLPQNSETEIGCCNSLHLEDIIFWTVCCTCCGPRFDCRGDDLGESAAMCTILAGVTAIALSVIGYGAYAIKTFDRINDLRKGLSPGGSQTQYVPLGDDGGGPSPGSGPQAPTYSQSPFLNSDAGQTGNHSFSPDDSTSPLQNFPANHWQQGNPPPYSQNPSVSDHLPNGDTYVQLSSPYPPSYAQATGNHVQGSGQNNTGMPPPPDNNIYNTKATQSAGGPSAPPYPGQ